ncbi:MULTISPECIES: glycosyltransferase family 87 protein [Bacteria]|uniref:glycosyltransferase family 87 protein n=1 Tax=Bacteria TaxID=2 RepID=UPI003C7B75FA
MGIGVAVRTANERGLPGILQGRDLFRPLLLLMACILAVGWMQVGSLLNQRQPDAGVYYYAAELDDALYRGTVEKPFMPSGGLPFTYTPFAAALFRLVDVIPFPGFTVLWACLNMIAVVAVVLLAGRSWSRAWQAFAAVVACCSTIAAAHVMMGQLNALLLLLVVVDLAPRARGGGGALPRGIGIGVATSIKLTPAIAILFLLCARRYRDAAVAAATAAVCFIVGTIAYPRSTADFFRQLPRLSERVDVLGYASTFQNTGISGVLAQLGMPVPTVLVGTVVVVCGLLVALRIRRNGGALVALWLSLVACLATPVTWIHHWIALPIALVAALRQERRRWCRSVLGVLLATQLTGSVYVNSVLQGVGPPALTALIALTPVLGAITVGIVLSRGARRQDEDMSARLERSPARDRLPATGSRACVRGRNPARTAAQA